SCSADALRTISRSCRSYCESPEPKPISACPAVDTQRPLCPLSKFSSGPSSRSAHVRNRACARRRHQRGDYGLSLICFRNEEEIGFASRYVIADYFTARSLDQLAHYRFAVLWRTNYRFHEIMAKPSARDESDHRYLPILRQRQCNPP